MTLFSEIADVCFCLFMCTTQKGRYLANSFPSPDMQATWQPPYCTPWPFRNWNRAVTGWSNHWGGLGSKTRWALNFKNDFSSVRIKTNQESTLFKKGNGDMSWISWDYMGVMSASWLPSRKAAADGSPCPTVCFWLEKALALAVELAQAWPFWESHLVLLNLAAYGQSSSPGVAQICFWEDFGVSGCWVRRAPAGCSAPLPNRGVILSQQGPQTFLEHHYSKVSEPCCPDWAPWVSPWGPWGVLSLPLSWFGARGLHSSQGTLLPDRYYSQNESQHFICVNSQFWLKLKYW